MTAIFGALSLGLSITGALYLQLPTFFLVLGHGWSHQYPMKRWIFRILAFAAFLLFIGTHPPLWVLLSVGIPSVFFWVFSLFNANPNLFVALSESQIIKQKSRVYPDGTQVVGYTDDGGMSICYPVEEMVMPRHILNDTFNGKPLLVSFCAACRSTMLYHPVVDGQRLTFEVLGVHRRNMIIRDLQTGTVWQQGTGEGMFGKLKGRRLDFHCYQQTTLEDWIKQNPDMFIAKEGDGIRKGLVPKKRLLKVLEKVTGKFIAPGRAKLAGLPLREKVWGLELDGRSKAYPISELKKETTITDKLGNVEITIHYNPLTNQMEGVITATRDRLNFQNHWWFGWKEFHPGTEIWRSENAG
ncbi:MAG: DUF3179 domain-containing protein [Spirochaetes bacterium]|nr:DUF3179 domain-containing protein [Spirochaetota bacterium]